ncbi:MAG: hypothetical protein AAFR59_05920 [Bacteroidota bacterium]
MKQKIGELLFQMIPVMLGVYLGFVVSNWTESVRQQEDYKLLIASLRSEMQVNQRQLEGIIDYHITVRDSSNYYASDSHLVLKPTFFKGTRMSKLTNSAYLTGIQTGTINALPIDVIQKVNQLYTLQKNYNDYGNLILASLINRDFSEKEEDLRNIARFLSITMVDVVALETQLIRGYEAIQPLLDESQK